MGSWSAHKLKMARELEDFVSQVCVCVWLCSTSLSHAWRWGRLRKMAL